MRNEQGQFVPREDGFSKVYGLRIRKRFVPALEKLAEARKVSPTEWIRQVVEEAIEREQSEQG